MTKEEMIEQLKHDRDLCNFDPFTGESEPISEDCRKSAEALDYAIKALEQQPCEDCVSRQAVEKITWEDPSYSDALNVLTEVRDKVRALPPVTPTQRWIPVSEKLPNDLEPVNITWVNHNPASYYANIKDKPFTATGVYFNGQWYWWSTTCTDILAEYSDSYDEFIDNDIEIIAWQPLPKPYTEKRDNKVGWSSLENVREKVERGDSDGSN